MNVTDVGGAAGGVVGFEMSNAFVSRWRACRIARDIPGVHMVRWPRRWVWQDEVFCEFELDGVRFTIEDPFGDSSYFTIIAAPPASAAVVARVRASYVAAGRIDWRFGLNSREHG